VELITEGDQYLLAKFLWLTDQKLEDFPPGAKVMYGGRVIYQRPAETSEATRAGVLETPK
jgi:hypothetical protein